MTQKNIAQHHLRDINVLLAQLSLSAFTPLSKKNLICLLQEKNNYVHACIADNKVVGVGMLIIARKMKGIYAYIEDMVVDNTFRGKGIGKQILLELLKEASRRGVRTVELTARPERTTAHALYASAGFTKKDTVVFRKHI